MKFFAGCKKITGLLLTVIIDDMTGKLTESKSTPIRSFGFIDMFVILLLTGITGQTLAQQSSLFGEHEQGSMIIDIKPGDDENVVRPSAGRIISVVIFSTDRLDVGEINPRTIRLNGVDVLLVGKSDKSLCQLTDVNADGLQDLLCDIRTTGFRVGEGEYRVILKAATYRGESLKAEDSIKVVLN